jgi:hypothetical protein
VTHKKRYFSVLTDRLPHCRPIQPIEKTGVEVESTSTITKRKKEMIDTVVYLTTNYDV